MKIAFIGLGQMGSGIARNLLEAGHELTVFNRSSEKMKALGEAGAVLAQTPADAGRGCEAAFTMLADDAAVTEVVFGRDGLTASLPQGSVHISLSTISVSLARRLASEHAEHKQGYLSAPVFGRPEAAALKKLLVVAAGDGTTIDRVRVLLDSIGRQTFVAGDQPWQANLVKLNGNFMLASMLETFGEAFATMRKAGVDHHLFYEIMTELFGSPVYKNYGAIIADQKFEPAAFTLKLGLKDIVLGLEAARELQVPMPIASVLRDHFLAAMANGQDKLDWSSVAMVPARLAGLEEK